MSTTLTDTITALDDYFRDHTRYMNGDDTAYSVRLFAWNGTDTVEDWDTRNGADVPAWCTCPDYDEDEEGTARVEVWLELDSTGVEFGLCFYDEYGDLIDGDTLTTRGFEAGDPSDPIGYYTRNLDALDEWLANYPTD